MSARPEAAEPRGELQRGLIATALGVLLGLVTIVFSRRERGRKWRGKSAI